MSVIARADTVTERHRGPRRRLGRQGRSIVTPGRSALAPRGPSVRGRRPVRSALPASRSKIVGHGLRPKQHRAPPRPRPIGGKVRKSPVGLDPTKPSSQPAIPTRGQVRPKLSADHGDDDSGAIQQPAARSPSMDPIARCGPKNLPKCDPFDLPESLRLSVPGTAAPPVVENDQLPAMAPVACRRRAGRELMGIAPRVARAATRPRCATGARR